MPRVFYGGWGIRELSRLHGIHDYQPIDASCSCKGEVMSNSMHETSEKLGFLPNIKWPIQDERTSDSTVTLFKHPDT